MPSTFTWVTAAPASDESSTRRRALPSVRPKPRSRGSTWKRPKSSDVCRASTFATIGSDKVEASSRTDGYATKRRTVSVAAPRCQAEWSLARIELDDQLFVDGDFDLVSTRQGNDLAAHVRDVKREPVRHSLAGETILDDLEIFKLARLRHHRDGVTRLDQRRREVGAAAVQGEVPVPDELPGLAPRAREAEPVHHVVQPALQHPQQLGAGRALAPVGGGIVLAKLALQHTIDVA